MEKEYFELDITKPIISQRDLEECAPILENPDKINDYPIMKILKEMEIKQGKITID